MKNLLLLIISICTILSIKAESYKVLYLGNSLTYVNNVPDLVVQIARANGDTITWDSNTPGGHKIVQHASNPTSLTKISDQDWDFVIIQAQSQETAFPDFQVDAEIVTPGIFLVDSIHKNYPCTKVFFYMPPGWQNGDNLNCAGFPEVCTYEGQYGRIRMAHGRLRDSMPVAIAPVGCAFRESRLADPSLLNWSTDNVHFTLSGSYLAALTIYKSITTRNTSGNTFDPGLGTSVCNFLQSISDRVVNDSINEWKALRGPALADAIIDVDSGSGADMHKRVTLYDRSTGEDTSWFVVKVKTKDGLNDSTYTLAGGASIIVNGERAGRIFYDIQLIASSCGKSDTQSYSKDLDLVSDVKSLSSANYLIYPNPFQSNVYILHEDSEFEVTILSVEGKVVFTDRLMSSAALDLSHLNKGIYILELASKSLVENTFRRLIIKE